VKNFFDKINRGPKPDLHECKGCARIFRSDPASPTWFCERCDRNRRRAKGEIRDADDEASCPEENADQSGRSSLIEGAYP
jgi:hypothetical protein